MTALGERTGDPRHESFVEKTTNDNYALPSHLPSTPQIISLISLLVDCISVILLLKKREDLAQASNCVPWSQQKSQAPEKQGSGGGKLEVCSCRVVLSKVLRKGGGLFESMSMYDVRLVFLP